MSVSTFEKIPDVRTLKLNNNRWACNCEAVEKMHLATARREQQPSLLFGEYRRLFLWG
jgi:hypothetical protein